MIIYFPFYISLDYFQDWRQGRLL